jgi:hypothetical protein
MANDREQNQYQDRDSHDNEASLTTLIDEEKYKSYADIQGSSPRVPFLRRHRFHIVILSLFILITTPFLYLSIEKIIAPYDQCGTTPSEALARDCVFETTGFAWLPRACLDPDMEDQFLSKVEALNLTYYRDAAYTQPVSLAEVRRGETGYYVHETYHKTHCGFLLRKLHKMWAEGRTVDGQILSQGHTKHCVDEMLGGEMMHAPGKAQFSYLKFPYCGRIGGYNLEWPKQRTWS